MARDGRQVTVLSHRQLVPTSDGRPVVLESSADITELKWLERSQAEARASELAIREVNQHLDTFFRTASHDLRQPLAVAKGQAEMAVRRCERLAATLQARGGMQAELATQVAATMWQTSQSIDRASRLAIELFDVARARTGTLEVQLAPLDLSALVRCLRMSAQARAHTSHLPLSRN